MTNYTVQITSKYGSEQYDVQTASAADGLYAINLPSEQGFSKYLMESDTPDAVEGVLTEWADTFYGSPVEITVISVTSNQ